MQKDARNYHGIARYKSNTRLYILGVKSGVEFANP